MSPNISKKTLLTPSTTGSCYDTIAMDIEQNLVPTKRLFFVYLFYKQWHEVDQAVADQWKNGEKAEP
jgi:hypothetical protein